MQVITTKVFEIMRQRKEKFIVHEGSSRSSKTYSIIQYLITKCLEHRNTKKKIRVLILRARLTWLKATAFNDFRDILANQFEMWDDRALNRKDNIYTLYGNEIYFSGLDAEGGMRFHGAKFDYTWFNECIEIDWSTVQQIILRMPGRGIFDFNPNASDDHWIFKKILTRKNSVCIHSTFQDNPFLPETIVKEIRTLEPTQENINQGTADETMWKIYGLGIRATLKGLIYTNYAFTKVWPENAEKIFYGMDFGFTNDPTTLIRVGLLDGQVYAQEMLYETNLTNIHNEHNPGQPSIEKELKRLKIEKDLPIWGDSAEPKSITDIAGLGYDIRAVKKGAGSIVDGITTVKRFKINVVDPSVHLASELRKYKWAEDKSGNTLNKPVDKFNDCLDALRYAIYMNCDFPDEVVANQYDSIAPNLDAERYSMF